MKVLVVADGHYYIDLKNTVYVESVFDYSFYARYLSVFDEVYAIVRAERVDNPPKKSKVASGPNVHFLPIPPSRGVAQYVQHYFETRKLVKKYVKDFDCAIFRVPGVVANLVSRIYENTGKPFAIEVVVDPWEYFAKGTVKGVSRPFVRIVWTSALKKICKKAHGVSYVTEHYLQKRYPCVAAKEFNDDRYFTSHYSSVELPDDQFGFTREYKKKKHYIISHVTNAFTGYGKGHIPLMNATRILLDRGYSVEVWFIGDGPLKNEFIQYAKNIGIEQSVKFMGRMPSGSDVRKKIKESDVFVFPTRAEGLPRVVLEAMSEGLPVISSPTCGIPEILPEECLVEYNNVEGFAEAIIKMIDDPKEMTKHSEDNLNRSKNFSSSILNERRTEFYRRLRRQVE